MPRLRVLLTNCLLKGPSGTEMYVHDVARELQARGHAPIVYSPTLGPLAERLAAAGIIVVSDLTTISQTPDVIHAHHSLETIAALLQFPWTPAIYVCHDAVWVQDTPPQLSRIGRYIAVDDTVRERLVTREGIDPRRVEVLFNGVDMQRFLPREPLPWRPKRALAFSNYLERRQFGVLRAACLTEGMKLDGLGMKLGGTCASPERLLRQYDLVFAKGRCAWEALAVGAAVIVCDAAGVGPLVTREELPTLRRANFGRRLLQEPLQKDVVARQIARYNAVDSARVSRQIRATASLVSTVDRLIDTYREVMAAHRAAPADSAADLGAIAKFLGQWPGATRNLPLCGREDEETLRACVREEQRRAEPPKGIRKFLHSLGKRLPSFLCGRRAA